MVLTLDTSAIIAVIADRPERPWIIEQTRSHDLIAPSSLHWEVGNAFLAMFKRKRITLAQALDALRIYQQIPLRLVDVAMDEALRLAQQLDLYAYDAYLLQTARQYNAPLLTLDGVLSQRARAAGIAIIGDQTS